MPANSVSPSIMAMMFDAVAKGELRHANVIGQVSASTLYRHHNKAARFVKEKPGVFRVEVYGEDETKPESVTRADSATEAKLLVVDVLVDAARAARAS